MSAADEVSKELVNAQEYDDADEELLRTPLYKRPTFVVTVTLLLLPAVGGIVGGTDKARHRRGPVVVRTETPSVAHTATPTVDKFAALSTSLQEQLQPSSLSCSRPAYKADLGAVGTTRSGDGRQYARHRRDGTSSICSIACHGTAKTIH